MQNISPFHRQMVANGRGIMGITGVKEYQGREYRDNTSSHHTKKRNKEEKEAKNEVLISKEMDSYRQSIWSNERFSGETYVKWEEKRGTVKTRTEQSKSVEELQMERRIINSQLQEMWRKNSILFKEGEEYVFTIHPYDYRLTVEGGEQKDALGFILNQEEIPKNLYQHILSCTRGHRGQWSEEGEGKYRLFWEVKFNTGYDLRELTREEGRFYTETGTDIMELYMHSAKIPSVYRTKASSIYKPYLVRLGKYGLDSVEDMELSIQYKDGFLYDLDEEYGYGPGQKLWGGQKIIERDEKMEEPERKEHIFIQKLFERMKEFIWKIFGPVKTEEKKQEVKGKKRFDVEI
ncbi:DUF4885 domain-containing protein [bacterium 1XD42-8]|nr:DUF4885 domain-containing protein [bacterium 1XD42-8]